MNPSDEQQQKTEITVTTTEPAPLLVHPEVLELKLKALKSDLRLMIIASVALNQVLANVELPSTASAVAITAAILAPAAKGVFAFFAR